MSNFIHVPAGAIKAREPKPLSNKKTAKLVATKLRDLERQYAKHPARVRPVKAAKVNSNGWAK